MITARQSREKAYQNYGWIILFALGILLVLNILILVAFESGAVQFSEDTGAAWAEVTAAYPGVAAAYMLNQHLLFLGFVSLALFGLVITWFGLRQGQRWAWYALWLLPMTLTFTALLMTQARQPELPVLYGGFALAAVIGLLLPIRKFFPKQST